MTVDGGDGGDERVTCPVRGMEMVVRQHSDGSRGYARLDCDHCCANGHDSEQSADAIERRYCARLSAECNSGMEPLLLSLDVRRTRVEER